MKPMRHDFGPLKISFVDPCSAGGYDLCGLDIGGLGGTEASILRVASGLRQQFDVTHYQNGRSTPQLSSVGNLLPLDPRDLGSDHDIIVVINRWKVALTLRKRYPETPIFLWLHVYPGRHNHKMGAALKAADITVICVSQTHAVRFSAFLGTLDTPRVRVIYNPLDDDLCPDDTPRVRDRLLFASSPHKGLGEVFAQFAALRQHIPDLNLAVADPGYLRWETGPVPDGVDFLGSLSHDALVQQMRHALCLFYPQTTFAETFGLVLAEANAVGTPALVHAGLGANAEIAAGGDQQVDGHDPAQILARVQAWRVAPPRVSANPDFRLSRVAEVWAQLFQRAAADRSHISMV